MQIAVFIKNTTLHPSYGGLETQNKNLCEELVKRGHKVYVFSPVLDYSGENETTENGVNYVFVNSNYRSLAGFASLDKNNWVNKSVKAFEKKHKINKFDIVLGQSSAALGLIKKKDKFNLPIISISHGTISGEFKTRVQSLDDFSDYLKLIPDTGYFLLNFFKRQREFIWNSDKIIAVSNAVKKAIIDETFTPDEKVEVVYNGIDSSSVKYPSEKDNREFGNRIRLVYLGLVHRSKGIYDLIYAVRGLKDFDLTIIGDGPHLKDLSKEIKYHNITDKVHLIGRVDHSKALDMLCNFDIFMLPSRRVEGFPMTLVEAMFAGLPIIGSDMGGIPEAIDENKTGFTIESGNINQLRDKINYLISNKEIRKEMSKLAREKAEEEFTIQKMVDDYEKIMKEVLK